MKRLLPAVTGGPVGVLMGIAAVLNIIVAGSMILLTAKVLLEEEEEAEES